MSETFKKLLKEYPQTAGAAQANYWIGWASFDAKDYKDAIAPMDTARKGDKTQFFEKATLYIMTCYLNLEDREKLASEVNAYPTTGTKRKIPIQFPRWLGAQYLNDKDYEQAEKYLTMVTARKDEVISDDWLNLGRCLSSQHRSDEAILAFNNYLEGAKEPVPRATGLLALGDAQLGIGKFDDAQKSVDQACALQPEGRLNAEGRIMAGEIQMARGDYDAAAKLFESVSVLLDDPAITPHAMELAIDALKNAGKNADAAKTLNDLQTRYAEYLAAEKERELIPGTPETRGPRNENPPLRRDNPCRDCFASAAAGICAAEYWAPVALAICRSRWRCFSPRWRWWCFEKPPREFFFSPRALFSCCTSSPSRMIPPGNLAPAFAEKPLVKVTGIVVSAPQEKTDVEGRSHRRVSTPAGIPRNQ